MKVKVISLPYIFQVLYVLCFTRPRYQVSVYRTIGPLVVNKSGVNSDKTVCHHIHCLCCLEYISAIVNISGHTEIRHNLPSHTLSMLFRIFMCNCQHIRCTLSKDTVYHHIHCLCNLEYICVIVNISGVHLDKTVYHHIHCPCCLECLCVIATIPAAHLGWVRTSKFSLAKIKINCHRNCGKEFAFTHSKEKC